MEEIIIIKEIIKEIINEIIKEIIKDLIIENLKYWIKIKVQNCWYLDYNQIW